MVEAMRWALCTGCLQEGAVTDAWQPETVCAMATSEGAAALGLADDLGALTPGRQADCVVFDCRRPPLTPCRSAMGTLVHTAQGREVEMVVVDGAVVVESGQPLRADPAEGCREAARAAASVRRRGGQ